MLVYDIEGECNSKYGIELEHIGNIIYKEYE